MSMFKDPFDPKALLAKPCGCGGAHTEADHGRLAATAVPAGEEARWDRVVDAAVLRAVFPVDAQRRLFLKTVGAATAMAAISSVLPLGTAREAFAQGGAPAISLGVGSAATPWTMPAIENINGQAITLAMKHKDKRDPKEWKGFKFAVPFDYSMHNYLLRYYVAEHGLDPDKDISIRSVPPPEMVANLRADNIDGYLGPDPFNQRAVYDGVGFIHLLTKELWDGHPCCAFAISKEFASQNPNSYRALLKAIIDATAFAAKPENRKEIAKAIAPQNYLNQPETVLEQVLTGTYADGLGTVKKDPNRIDFDPFPWNQFAIWILTQMKRWGQLKADVDYAKVAADVFLATDTAGMMKEMGFTPPDPSKKTIVVMGKAFDPSKPQAYVDSFAIKRT